MHALVHLVGERHARSACARTGSTAAPFSNGHVCTFPTRPFLPCDCRFFHRLDLSVDPNDRPVAGSCFLGDPQVANRSPNGLARFCTHQSWVSQWSYDKSNGNGLTHVARVSVPTLVLENSADDGVPASHLRDLFAASGAKDKHASCLPLPRLFFVVPTPRTHTARAISVAPTSA